MYDELAEIARTEFSDLVLRTEQLGRRASAPLKLRLHLRDETFVDVWLNPTATDYSYHWEHRAKRGLLHRHDNAPDHPEISTHPSTSTTVLKKTSSRVLSLTIHTQHFASFSTLSARSWQSTK